MAELIRDRYEPIEVVGRGGQGQVIRASDRLHNREVALKVRDAGDESNRESLLGEARALFGAGPHPGLPLLREDFFLEDRYVLVMDWVEGSSLESVLERQGDPGLPASTVVGWLEQVADALDHLHGRGVVHGDVKPANIVLQSDGRAVLVDFGLAGLAGHGTLGFAPPEAWSGEPLTPAADVFSLAATAIALLTGQPPGEWPPSWEGLPRAGALSRALRSAVQTDPQARPARASQLVERLRGWLAADLPGGVVTFLMTAVEDAVTLWEQEGEAMRVAIDAHDRILAEVVETHGGVLVGDQPGEESRMAVFARASDGARCAVEIRSAFESERWPTSRPLRLRVALHAGEAEPREGSYVGPQPMRAARLRDLAPAGQILVSESAADLLRNAGPELVELGPRTLQGLTGTERVFALGPLLEPITISAGPSPGSTAAPGSAPAPAGTPAVPTEPPTSKRRGGRTPVLIGLVALVLVAGLVGGLLVVSSGGPSTTAGPTPPASVAPGTSPGSTADTTQLRTLYEASFDGRDDFFDAVGRGDQPGTTVRSAGGSLLLEVTEPQTNAGVDLRMDGVDVFAGEIEFSVVPGSEVTFDWGLRWGGGRDGAGVVPGSSAYIVRLDTAREVLSLVHFDQTRDPPAELLADEVPVSRLQAGRTVRVSVIVLRTAIAVYLDSHKVIDVQDDRVAPVSSIPNLDVFAAPGTGGVRITRVRITTPPASTTQFV